MKSQQRYLVPGGQQGNLAALLDLPLVDDTSGTLRQALYAHCFTCSKDSLAAARIGRGLSQQGVSLLRFDFTGLGGSPGEFAKTHLTSNIAEVLCVADFLTTMQRPAKLLVGHSLGAVAMVMAAPEIASAQALVLINAPPRADHLLRHFAKFIPTIQAQGAAQVPIYDPTGERRFTITRQFIEDLQRYDLQAAIAQLKVPLLMVYSMQDDLITLEETLELFNHAAQPKTLLKLEGADHILTDRQQGIELGETIAAWAKQQINGW